jgi:hypothetical protein
VIGYFNDLTSAGEEDTDIMIDLKNRFKELKKEKEGKHFKKHSRGHHRVAVKV